jgi:hypothetical protein
VVDAWQQLGYFLKQQCPGEGRRPRDAGMAGVVCVWRRTLRLLPPTTAR